MEKGKKDIRFITRWILLLLIVQGCLNATESDYEKQVREADETLKAWVTENQIEAQQLPTGLYMEFLRENQNGKTVVEDHVAGILYTMRNLAGGEVIETHTDSLNPLRFSYSFSNSYNAIHPVGLNYEISRMKQGEKVRFYIPNYMAFGEFSHHELFGPFTNFILDVELLELKTEEEIYEEELARIHEHIENGELNAEPYPNGLFHVTLEEGIGVAPETNSLVEFHYTRTYLDGTVIETTTEGDPIRLHRNSNQMVAGLNEGIGLMREGEKALLIMPSKLAFGKSVQVIPQQLRDELADAGEINPRTRPFSPVIYEVELIGIE